MLTVHFEITVTTAVFHISGRYPVAKERFVKLTRWLSKGSLAFVKMMFPIPSCPGVEFFKVLIRYDNVSEFRDKTNIYHSCVGVGKVVLPKLF